jgi:hypothetical protein
MRKNMSILIKSPYEEVKILREGSKQRGFFFGILGVLFQIIFVWGYWSFLGETGPWATVWLTLINSEFFPFTFILFVFGAGCILIALRELGWKESILITKRISPDSAGIRKEIQLFRWLRATLILKNQIVTLRLHSILLDEFGVNKSYQIEIDYREDQDSSVKTLILYKEHEDKMYEPALRLVNKIHEILSLPDEIEKTESATLQMKKKKERKVNTSKMN